VEAPSSLAFAPILKATGATVVIGLCLLFLPFAPVILMPFLVLPLAHLVAGRGLRGGVIVALLTGGLIYLVVGASSALFIFLLIVFVGMGMGYALRRGWRFGQTLAATTGGALVAFTLWGTATWLLFDLTLSRLRESAYASIDDAAALYLQMGVGAATTDSVSSLLRRFVDILPYLAPGILGMGVILLAASSLGLAYLIFPRLKHKLSVGLSLSKFRMHWGVAYASIAGLAMVVFSRGDGDWRTVMLYVGINILLVSQTLFFVQGLAVVRWYAVTRKLSSGSGAALFAAAVVGQALVHLTALAGLFDTWVDYRKRFALKSPGAGGIR
jgi:uncharacterized protein YybS (DUF2232 family)